MPVQLGSAYGKVEIDFTGIKRGVEAAAGQLSAFEANAKRIGSTLKSVGDDLTRNVTLPLVAVGTAAGKLSMDFEASMQQIVGLVGVSQQQVNAWSADLQRIGPEISRGPKELADALYFVTSSGLKGAEALDAVTVSGRAAAAGLGDTKVVADAVTSAMNAYRTSNLTAAQAADILVATVREGKGEADTIAPALGRVIPIAAQLGISFDQVGAAMAGMTLVGFDAAEAGTNLSGIMSALLKPSKQAADVMGEFGLSGEQLRQLLKEQGLLAVLNLLRDTIGQDDEALAKIFPNIRGFRGLLSLVGENAQQVSGIFERMTNTTGDADRAFQAAAQTAKFKFNAAMAMAQGGLIQFGNAVLPVVIPILQSLADTLSKVADWFSKLSDETKQTIVQVLLIVAALGPVLAIGGRLIGMVGTLIGLFKTLGTVLKLVGRIAKTGFEVVQYLVEAGAAGLAVLAAFAAVAAAVVVVIKFLDAAGRAARATNEELIKMANSDTGNVIEDSFNRAGASFEILENGSQRLRDAFVAHQEEMRKKLLAGEITLEDYNTEIERSAKVAGLWAQTGLYGSLRQTDSAVKILTADQAELAKLIDDENPRLQQQARALNALDAGYRGVADATQGVSDATQDATDKANAFAKAQEEATAADEKATAELDRLRALIDGEVGPAYDDYIGKTDELTAKQEKLREELAKLEASQGTATKAQEKGALTTNELTAAQTKQAAILEDLTNKTRKKKETDAELTARMAGLQVQYDNLTEKIGGASSATTGWVDNSKRIGEIKGELSDLDKALQANAVEYDKRLKQILFDMAAEQLAANGLTNTESQALIALALKYGIIDQKTAEMQMAVLTATEKLANDQNIGVFVNSLDTLEKKMGGLPDAVGGAADTAVGRLKAAGGDFDAEALDMAEKADAAAAKVKAAEEAKVTAFIVGTPAIIGSVDEEAASAERAAARTKAAFDSTGTTAGIMQTNVGTALSSIQSYFGQYGPGIGDPLVTGMQTARNGVVEALNAILEKISAVISAMTGIHVPNIQIPSGGTPTGGTPVAHPVVNTPVVHPVGNCFVAGTPITLADWSQKPIEAIEAGERVMSFDPFHMANRRGAETQSFVEGVVTKTLRQVVMERFRVVFESGLQIEVTGEHPFYMPIRRPGVPTIHGDFVRVKDLRVGDQLVAFDRGVSFDSAALRSGCAVEKIAELMKISDTVVEVFNFNVEPHHTYIAHGLIVHNIKLAAGGQVVAGHRYIWQESGATRPEILVPSRPGYVLTRQEAQSALSAAASPKGDVNIGGDTFNTIINDRTSQGMFNALVNERRRARLNSFMGG